MLALARRALVLALATLPVVAGPAAAADLVDQRVAVATPVDRSCLELLPAGDGVVHRELTAPATGYLTARLSGGSGDWDVAVFKRSGGAPVAAAASRGADEVAAGLAGKGAELTVQACRRSGRSDAADLSVTLDEFGTAAKAEKLSLVNVVTPSQARKNQLNALGLDVTEHGGNEFVAVVLHGADDAAKLRKANFVYTLEVGDLAAQSARDRAADRHFAAVTATSALPSGRTTYRRLADYSNEMKKLAADNPDLVKPITLNHKTWEGRTVEGIEITTNPNARDGKPIFLQMGLHHAREWPSGEHSIEWAYELINGYRAGDPRLKPLVEKTRTIVIPVVNPDGFNISREAGEAEGGGGGRGTPNPGQSDETVNIVGHPYEYRRKNCRFVDDSKGGSCVQPALGLAAAGVDPNRNYGGFWGGPGASSSATNETYRGPSAFSEPETQNVRELISTRQVTTLITNHTFSNLVLRPPGIQSQGLAPDEPIYKALGDSMAAENGYTSQFSWQLYDTTGTTEDWSYYATGGLGFTFEIGCLDKAANGECKTGHFHPPYAEMVKEYEGNTPFSDPPGHDGGGNRAAYLKAQESTADTSRHAVLTGTAPAGAILRLTKEFDTPTSLKTTFKDRLDTTMQVPADGKFEWHVNQSTRPLVIKERGRQPTGPPSAPQAFSGSPATPPDGAAPCADANTTMSTCFNVHEVTVPTGGDNATATIRIEWTTPGSDWDMKVFRDTDGNGTLSAADEMVGASEQGTTDFEQVTVANPVAGGKYFVRVTNFAAAEPYNGTVTYAGPDYQAAQRESWTLTCEPTEGQAATTQAFEVDRGQSKAFDLSGCAARAAATAGGAGGAGALGPGSAADGGTAPGAQGATPDKRERPRIDSRLSVTFDGSFYTARISGSLLDTHGRAKVSGAGAAQRCGGDVRIAIKAGKRQLATRRAAVGSACAFAKTIKFSRTALPRSLRASGSRLALRAVTRYGGNRFLLPASRTTSARVRGG